MQQTKNLNLNIIESTDTFSPEPLNDNAQKLEDAIQAAEGKADAAVTAVSAALASHSHFVTGLYDGTGHANKFTLGFRPRFVIIVFLIQNATAYATYSTVTIFPDGWNSSILTIQDDGFMLSAQSAGLFPAANVSGDRYFYIAFR